MSALLQVRGLAAGYGHRRLIEALDLAIEPGEVVLLLGHNGAGKTTLVRSIFGLLPPLAGSVHYRGSDITGQSPGRNVAAGIAFVPQGHGIFPRLSVEENLRLGAFTVADKGLVPERLDRVYQLFPILAERAAQRGGTLSGGQQQMLAIGMALMHAPQLLILDEPSIGLAPKLVGAVMASIREINSRLGTTILLVEQNVTQSLTVAGRAVVMKTGRKVYEGAAAALEDRSLLMQFY